MRRALTPAVCEGAAAEGAPSPRAGLGAGLRDSARVPVGEQRAPASLAPKE